MALLAAVREGAGKQDRREFAAGKADAGVDDAVGSTGAQPPCHIPAARAAVLLVMGNRTGPLPVALAVQIADEIDGIRAHVALPCGHEWSAGRGTENRPAYFSSSRGISSTRLHGRVR